MAGVVNDLDAELWNIAWSVVPDIIIEGAGTVNNKTEDRG